MVQGNDDEKITIDNADPEPIKWYASKEAEIVVLCDLANTIAESLVDNGFEKDKSRDLALDWLRAYIIIPKGGE